MSTIERGRTVTLRYREEPATGKATLVIEISAGSDILPHEHREDTRNVAAELLDVPVAALAGVEVELKRVPGDHHHGEDGHHHPPATAPGEAAPERPKVKS